MNQQQQYLTLRDVVDLSTGVKYPKPLCSFLIVHITSCEVLSKEESGETVAQKIKALSRLLMETNVVEPQTRIRPSICIDNLAAGTVLRQSGTESAQQKETAEACSPPETGDAVKKQSVVVLTEVDDRFTASVRDIQSCSAVGFSAEGMQLGRNGRLLTVCR